MSLTQSLNNAVSGLNASSRMAEIVSANLANAQTEGYGKRTLALSASSIGGYGAGVSIDGVNRHVNDMLISDRRMAGASTAHAQVAADALNRLEGQLGAIDSSDTLASFVANLENSLIVAGSDPSSDLRLNDVLGSLDALVQKLNDSTASVQILRQDADAAIAGQVSQLNSNLQRVQTLNTDIQTALSHGLDAAALMDQRQQVVDGISELVPIRVLGRSGGQIAIMSEAGTMLLDGKAAEIGFSPQHTITAETTMTSGGLSGLTVNNVDTPVEKLAGGALSANFELRDETLPAVQADLDAFAADMIARFEQAGVDPTVTSGQPSLLTDAGSVLNVAVTVGLAGRISINASIDPEAGGQVWRLRDGVGAAAMGATGENAQINRWLTALETDLGGGNAASRAADVVSAIGSRRVAAEDTLAQSSARLSGLLEAELSTGVDTDAELQTLLMVEQNYAANARLIQAVEEMMRHLMEI